MWRSSAFAANNGASMLPKAFCELHCWFSVARFDAPAVETTEDADPISVGWKKMNNDGRKASSDNALSVAEKLGAV
jgi:hypothetical protein